MGTNYYVHFEECKCCGATPEPIHIGKNSYGWQFSFFCVPGVAESWPEWQMFLEDKNIVDEYGRDISFLDFKEIVDVNKSQPGNKNHTTECWLHPEPWEEDDENYLDPSGHSFSRREFS